MCKIKIINRTRRCDESCKCGVRPCWCDEHVDCECLFREHAIIYRPATKAWAAGRGGETRHPPPSPARRSGVRIPPTPCRWALSRRGRPRGGGGGVSSRGRVCLVRASYGYSRRRRRRRRVIAPTCTPYDRHLRARRHWKTTVVAYTVTARAV